MDRSNPDFQLAAKHRSSKVRIADRQFVSLAGPKT